MAAEGDPLALMAQIAFPLASDIAAPVPADWCEQADDPIDESALDPVHGIVTARTCGSVRGPFRGIGRNTIGGHRHSAKLLSLMRSNSRC